MGQFSKKIKQKYENSGYLLCHNLNFYLSKYDAIALRKSNGRSELITYSQRNQNINTFISFFKLNTTKTQLYKWASTDMCNENYIIFTRYHTFLVGDNFLILVCFNCFLFLFLVTKMLNRSLI